MVVGLRMGSAQPTVSLAGDREAVAEHTATKLVSLEPDPGKLPLARHDGVRSSPLYQSWQG